MESKPPLNEDDAARQYAEAEARLKQQVQRGRKQFAYNYQLAKDRLAFAVGELSAVEAKRQALAPHLDRPEVAYHDMLLEALRHAYASLKRMMEIQAEANQHNLAVLEVEPLPQNPVYRVPEQETDYMEARAYMDVSMAIHHWIRQAEGLDVILRATGHPPAILEASPEDEAERASAAEALQSAMAEKADLAMLVGPLGTELAEAFRLAQWGKQTLAECREAPEAQKRQALAQPDWAKLSGKVILLGGLAERLKHEPLVASRLPQPEAEPLPYAPVEWAEPSHPQAAGTDRLVRSSSRPL